MLAKIITVMSIMFVSQTIISCDECGLGGPSAYDVVFNEAIITIYDTSGFSSSIAVDSVYKIAFGLGINIKREDTPISMNAKRSFGFSSSFACDPVPPRYNIEDPISEIDLFTINSLTGEKSNAEGFFTVNFKSLDEAVEAEKQSSNSDYSHGGRYVFNLEPTKLDSIPNSVIFRIEATLQSGTVLSDQSPTIILKG